MGADDKVLIELVSQAAQRYITAIGKCTGFIDHKYRGHSETVETGSSTITEASEIGAVTARQTIDPFANSSDRRGEVGSASNTGDNPVDLPRKVVNDPPSQPTFENFRNDVIHRFGLEPSDPMVNKRAWGEAVQARRDMLREMGLTGRVYELEMQEWRFEMERQARRTAGGLPFPLEMQQEEPRFRRTYRGAFVEPSTAFDQGFKPWGDNPDLGQHQKNSRIYKSNYIATTKSLDKANEFATPAGYTYLVRDMTGGTDINDRNEAIGDPDNANKAEEEIAFRGGVPPERIEGVLYDKNDLDAGFEPNPNFRPTDDFMEPPKPPRQD